LTEVSGDLHVPAALPTVLIQKVSGWAPEPVWTPWRRETFPPPARNLTPVFQSVVHWLYWQNYSAKYDGYN